MAEYIDREVLITNSVIVPGGNYVVIDKDIFDSLPHADVVPIIHAKWVVTENGDESCSNCNWTPEGDHDSEYNYCPICGVKMDKE